MGRPRVTLTICAALDRCRRCGCTDDRACQPHGCAWTDDAKTMCTACVWALALAGERQAIVDAAHVLLLIDSARAYGLVTGGPEVALGTCELVLLYGRAAGIVPSASAVESALGPAPIRPPGRK